METNNIQNVILQEENLQQPADEMSSNAGSEVLEQNQNAPEPDYQPNTEPGSSETLGMCNDGEEMVSTKIDQLPFGQEGYVDKRQQDQLEVDSSIVAFEIEQMRRNYNRKFVLTFACLLGVVCVFFALFIYGHLRSANLYDSITEQINDIQAEAEQLNEQYQSDIKQIARQADGLQPFIVYDIAYPQVVAIRVDSPDKSRPAATDVNVEKTADGSGFFVDGDGYIVTNYHVVKKNVEFGYPIEVAVGEEDFLPATLVGYKADNDIAVIKIDKTDCAVPSFADPSGLHVGDKVYAVGTALGKLFHTFSTGYISAVDRLIDPTGTADIRVLQLDIAVNEGNSGCPVYNSNGEIVGMIVAKFSSGGAEGLAFMIPSDEIKIAWKEIVNQQQI